MSTSVTLPALGESVTEGTVTRWLKQIGDAVEADEPLLEVSTDKVDTEIPSPAAGVLLEINAQEDETVEVGAVLGVIGDESESGADDAASGSIDSDVEPAGVAAQVEEEPTPAAPASEPQADEPEAAEPEAAEESTEQTSAPDEAPEPSAEAGAQPVEGGSVPLSRARAAVVRPAPGAPRRGPRAGWGGRAAGRRPPRGGRPSR